MKKLISIILFFFGFITFAQRNYIPKGYKIIEEKKGDLDNDGINEKVIVFETSDSTDFGYIREIQILKKSNTEWIEWKKSRNAILKSQDGGMMGDPYGDIEIKNGILIINQNGGSSWKWGYTDKYRFQNNEFELIGYTSNYGKLCEYWANFDFNLSTGKIIYKKEFEDCDKNQEIYKTEKETFYKKGFKINLENRNSEKFKIISPKNKFELNI